MTVQQVIRDGILDLHKVTVPDTERFLKELVSSAVEAGVRAVFCTGFPLYDQHLAILAKLRSVTVLGLMATQIRGVGLSHLRNMSELKVLDLTACPLTGEGLETVSQCPSLLTLRLGMSTVPLEKLQALQSSRLEELELTDLPLSDKQFAALLELPMLERLLLDGRDLTVRIVELMKNRQRKIAVQLSNAKSLRNVLSSSDLQGDTYSLLFV